MIHVVLISVVDWIKVANRQQMWYQRSSFPLQACAQSQISIAIFAVYDRRASSYWFHRESCLQRAWLKAFQWAQNVYGTSWDEKTSLWRPKWNQSRFLDVHSLRHPCGLRDDFEFISNVPGRLRDEFDLI